MGSLDVIWARGGLVVVVGVGWGKAIAVATLELRVGDVWGEWVEGSRKGVRPRGVQVVVSEVGVVAGWSLDGVVRGVAWMDFVGEGRGEWVSFVGEGVGVGVVGRRAVEGEEGESGRRKGDAGDSGRRNGEVRGEPYESGDGLYVGGRDCWRSFFSIDVLDRLERIDIPWWLRCAPLKLCLVAFRMDSLLRIDWRFASGRPYG